MTRKPEDLPRKGVEIRGRRTAHVFAMVQNNYSSTLQNGSAGTHPLAEAEGFFVLKNYIRGKEGIVYGF